MTQSNRTPPVPSPTALPTIPPKVEVPADLSADGLDVRSYARLTPLQQLERLEVDQLKMNAEEVERRKADARAREMRLAKKEGER